MSFIVVENLTKAVYSKVLLDKVDLAINRGDKIALVAKNGSGKSTLLKILAGKEKYDTGKITTQNGITIGYLPQTPDLDLEKTVYEEVLSSGSRLMSAVREYEESLAHPEDNKRLQVAYDAMNSLQAWDYVDLIQSIFLRLKLDNPNALVSTLSGGQRKRVALAKVLLDKDDVLILDEPTNHLDIEMIDWLEEFLAAEDITLLLVTHDRYFLDKVCNQILELDGGKMFKYKGNYQYYLEKKESRIEINNTTVDRTKALLKKELEWVKKSPQGRSTKSSARVDAYYETKSQLGQKYAAEKTKLDVLETRLGSKILEVHNLTKSFGDKKIIDKFTYRFNRGVKIGIVGNNGAGKTTFINMLLGIEEPDSGNVVTGETVSFGYYSQHQAELDESLRVIEAVREVALHIKLSDGSEVTAAKMLERFLFSGPEQQTLISQLSGGERKRLALLLILMKNPNFLILDEPTNDFDLMTLDVLEEFLRNFNGCLIVVSHDRYFMDNIVDHLFIFKGAGEIEVFPGTYSEYRARKASQPEPTATEVISATPAAEKLVKQPTSSQAANELYKEIAKLEKQKARLMEQLYDSSKSYEELGKMKKDLQALDLEIATKNEQWLMLSL